MIRYLLEKTLYEYNKGREPNISYFRTFDCKYFTHNNRKDNLEKFEASSDKEIFLGYSLHRKSYRLNQRTKYVEESVYVGFYESCTVLDTSVADESETEEQFQEQVVLLGPIDY